MAAEGRSTVHEESSIRELVENCANNDDITPLVRLVFEAQSIATDPRDIQADGLQMVALLGSYLQGVAGEQRAAVNDICHTNAGAIASTVSELEAVGAAVEEVKAALVAGNTQVQDVGRALVDKAAALQQLLDMAGNLQAAAGATAAARSVLVECLGAGTLVGGHQLYPALCALDSISQQHLGALLQLLQPSKGASAAGTTSSSAAAAAAAAAVVGGGGGGGGGVGGGRRLLSSSERAALEQLQSYFSSLVDELAGAVGALALADFNNWLVSVRAAARPIGMACIRAAQASRALEEALGAERKMLAAALAGGRGLADMAAEVVAAPWRQELLGAQQRPGAGSSGGALGGGGVSSGGAAPGRPALASSVQQLSAMLKRPGSNNSFSEKGSRRRGGGGREGEEPTPADQQQQRPGEFDLERLAPGAPEGAIAHLVGAAVGQRGTGDGRRWQQPAGGITPSPADRASAAAAAGGGDAPGALLLGLDLRGLSRALHVAAASGSLPSFQSHYMEQRRLQLVADLQPPTNFLEAYQPYLAQVTGFFVIEAYVARVTDGAVAAGPGRLLLWDAALRQLAVALERALEGLGAADAMLAVKDFLLLVATALERAGYQVAPLSEILLSARGRYHSLLGSSLTSQVTSLVEGDVLGELLVRTQQQAAQYAALGLPWALDPPPGGRGPPPLPYPAPFTSCVPGLLQLLRRFAYDSAAYLRSLYNPWELAPALLHHRDRVLGKLLVDVLSAKAATAAALDQVRELLLCAANAACLAAACDALDAYTLALARSGVAPPPDTPAGDISISGSDQSGRTAAGGGGGGNRLGSSLAGALRGLQESSEREVGRKVGARLEEALAAAAAKTEWTPAAAAGRGTSPWVDGLLSYLQETFDAALKLLPRASAVALLRGALAGLSAGITSWFGPGGGGGGPKAFNLYAAGRLAADVSVMERWAGRWGVPGLEGELAELVQLLAALLSGRLEEALSPEVRAARYPALDPVLLAAAADKYKELPGQAKKEPAWPTKRAVEAFAKQLRAQLVSGTG